MRDTHRMREKYDLSLDSRQVVSLLIGGIVVLGAVFVLGVLVGKKLAGTPRADHGPDLLTALDNKSDALERARAAPPLTFQEELTRPTASAPALARPPAAAPMPPAAAGPTVVRAPAATAIAPAATASVTAPGGPTASASTGASKASPPPTSVTASGAPTASASKGSPPPTSVTASGAPTASASKASPPPTSVTPSAAPATSTSKSSPPTAATKTEPARPAHTESVATRTAPTAAHPAPPKVPEVTSATGAFTLQLGASLSRDDAERQASRLREKGYAPYIVTAEVPGKGTWYRVRMGSFPTKDAATRYLQDFKRETQAEAFVASTR